MVLDLKWFWVWNGSGSDIMCWCWLRLKWVNLVWIKKGSILAGSERGLGLESRIESIGPTEQSTKQWYKIAVVGSFVVWYCHSLLEIKIHHKSWTCLYLSIFVYLCTLVIFLRITMDQICVKTWLSIQCIEYQVWHLCLSSNWSPWSCGSYVRKWERDLWSLLM